MPVSYELCPCGERHTIPSAWTVFRCACGMVYDLRFSGNRYRPPVWEARKAKAVVLGEIYNESSGFAVEVGV